MIVEDCIFCKIIRGEIPCAKVYETHTVLAFLDIAPVNKGHALVIPKAHYENIWELPASLATEMLVAVQTVGQALKDGLGAQGMNLGMNNGAAAGQAGDARPLASDSSFRRRRPVPVAPEKLRQL